MMRTGSSAASVAARVGLGPGGPPRRAALLLAACLAVAAGVTATVTPAVPDTLATPETTATPTTSVSPSPRAVAALPDAVPGEPGSDPPRGVMPAGLGRSVPVRVVIPAIGVDAEVVPLALDRGELKGLPDAGFAGWYRRGTSPGEIGSAVLLGRLGGYEAGAGAFAGLDRLAPRDRIEVVRADGTTARFTVDEVLSYAPVPVEHGARGDAQLRLVGAGGPGVDRRPELVVFATLAP